MAAKRSGNNQRATKHDQLSQLTEKGLLRMSLYIEVDHEHFRLRQVGSTVGRLKSSPPRGLGASLLLSTPPALCYI